MPVVSLVSPKGGVGKTTTALLIASTLDHRGQNVVLLDGDPNQPLTALVRRGPQRPADHRRGALRDDRLRRSTGKRRTVTW